MADESVVYLVTVGSKPNETGFFPLSAEPYYQGEYAGSGRPLVGHETWYTSCARGGRCVLAWVATSRDSPFPDGARELQLGHGETVQMLGRTYLVYVEPAGAVCDQALPERPSYDAGALATLDSLTDDQRRDAAERFLGLPYTRRAWAAEFEDTGFVQCRDGKVPYARRTVLRRKDGILRLQFEVAVFDLFEDSWLRSHSMSFEWKLQAFDLEMLSACATSLSILPVWRDK